jgi:tRNA 2-(methylsulfanyl)-N6-isopentenyladenosine37 hydroxylase
MPKLRVATSPAWAPRAAAHFDEVLLDHAHCEKKAAGVAVALLFQYPDRASLLRPLSALAREELAHFEAVLAWLERRGVAYARQRPSPYAGRLRAIVRAEEPARLVDTLLVSAVIEARSCERLGLLADALDDPELAAFYRELRSAEARHQGLYMDLARAVLPSAEVRARLEEVLDHEARVLAECRGRPRLHESGAG